MTEEKAAPVLPTVTGFATRLAITALRKGGVPIAPLLQRAGLSVHDVEDRQGRISAAAQAKFLEDAARAMDDSAFAIHLAAKSNPREGGLLFYVVSAATSLSDALALLARHSRIVNEAGRVKLTRTPEGVVVDIDFVGLPRHEARQATEFSVAIVVRMLREAGGRIIRPTSVSFVHGRNSNLREFERFFGCSVEFAAERDQLVFSNETLAVPLVTGDRYLLETLQPICDAAAKERNTAAGTARVAVENEVQKLLPNGRANKKTAAAKLAMSARTLSRRLADEGTTYEEVVDQLRRSLALQYVKEPGISPFTDCILARLRGDGAVALRGSRREDASSAAIRRHSTPLPQRRRKRPQKTGNWPVETGRLCVPPLFGCHCKWLARAGRTA